MGSDFKIVDYILSLSEQTSSCHTEIDSYDKTLQTIHSLAAFIMFFNSIICLFSYSVIVRFVTMFMAVSAILSNGRTSCKCLSFNAI